LLFLAACAMSLIVGLFAFWSLMSERSALIDPKASAPPAAERQCARRGLSVGDRKSAIPGPRSGWQCTGSCGRGAVLFSACGSGIVAAPEGGVIGPALVVRDRRGVATQLFSTSTSIGGLVRARWLLSRERPGVGRRA